MMIVGEDASQKKKTKKNKNNKSCSLKDPSNDTKLHCVSCEWKKLIFYAKAFDSPKTTKNAVNRKSGTGCDFLEEIVRGLDQSC